MTLNHEVWNRKDHLSNLLNESNAIPPASVVGGMGMRGNEMFEGQQATGLVDFGQAGFRWKGFDFARLFGSDRLSARQSTCRTDHLPASCMLGKSIAWEVYSAEHPTPGCRLEDAILMHRISTALTLEISLDRMDQIGVTRFDFERPEEIVEMIEAML